MLLMLYMLTVVKGAHSCQLRDAASAIPGGPSMDAEEALSLRRSRCQQPAMPAASASIPSAVTLPQSRQFVGMMYVQVGTASPSRCHR